MKKVYDVLMLLRATSSKNEKLAILQRNAGNTDLKEFLRVTYEPRINFYQKKIDPKAFTEADRSSIAPVFDVDFINEVVRTLGGRLLTGTMAKRWLAAKHEGLRAFWEKELLEILISRDVRAGFSESTINKVWPELVTDVPYMRCSLPKDAKLDRFDWKLGVISQIKADGMFAAINHHSNGTVTIMSRNGSPFPLVAAFDSLVAEVKEFVPKGCQVHGELLMYKNSSMLPRQEGNGKFNSLLQSGEIDGEGFQVAYECWDIIPIMQATAKNKYTTGYFDRFKKLCDLLNQGAPRVALWLIDSKVVHSLEEANAHYRDALERGLEGTIIKCPTNLIWEDSTSKWQVKMKLEFEVDLRVTGYVEGKGKAAGMLGALDCETSDGKLKVQVGSGFTDAMRKDIWQRQNLNIVTVKANSIMPPTRKDTYSLFLPIFVEERLDKKVADTLEKVQAQYDAAISSVA